MMVVEQGKDLPVMDLLSSDPYVKVWHQEAAPPRQPRKAAAGTASPRRCCCSGDTKAPVEFRSTTLTHIGQSPFVKENLNPVWKFRCEHELTLRPGHRMDKGWLCVEICLLLGWLTVHLKHRCVPCSWDLWLCADH